MNNINAVAIYITLTAIFLACSGNISSLTCEAALSLAFCMYLLSDTFEFSSITFVVFSKIVFSIFSSILVFFITIFPTGL